jgi:pimeloyl-ACP methyl ester carboxylesterase
MKPREKKENMPSTYAADKAATEYVTTGRASYAYRTFGNAEQVPLVLLHRFRGTLDHWDPKFIDILSATRQVIVFDSAGVGFSTGTVPDSINEMAEAAADFIAALDYPVVDVLGWSMGGSVGLALALQRPGLVRKLVVAASGPGDVPGTPPASDRIPEIALRDKNLDEDFLFLFFPETPEGRAAGLESLRRLDIRLLESQADASPQAYQAQAGALAVWHSGKDTAWERLDEITIPVLVANGAHDVMEPAFQTYMMNQRLRNSKAILYGDAGHAFLFQHAEDFGREVLDFLAW